MAATEQTDRARKEVAGRDYPLVDSDVHPLVADVTVLREHMSARAVRRIFGETLQVYARDPNRIPHPTSGLRLDALTPSGGPPGSDPAYALEQWIDPCEITAAVLIPVQAGVMIPWGDERIGTEFLNPEYARLFINGAFGWPTLPSTDLPSGGPGYPLGTPAIRVRIDPMEGLTLFTAVFNGDPTGAGVGGSQLADASGTAFRIGDGAFIISEIRYNEGSADHQPTYRFGGWYNTERFSDRRFDTTGLSLADPASNGRPSLHGGDYSFYASVDYPFLEPDSKNGFLLFARAMGAPSDRNLVSFYADAGVTYNGPFGFDDDKVGLAVGYARIGQAARALDADVTHFTGQPFPVRSGEAVLELTYSHKLAEWLQVQPDFQYIFNPGGSIANPIAPTRRIGDAAVFGIRSVVTF